MEVTNNERDISSCTTAADINGGALSLLPPEILVNIFSFFSDSVKDLLLCAQVNQTWHHIITSFYIWRTVKFNKFETFSRFHEILQLITKTRRNRALDNWSRFVKAYLNVIKSPISRTSEEYEEEEEKDLLIGLTNRSLYWIEMRCSKLTTLNIGFCVIITPNALQSLVNRCKELTSLTISHCLNTRAISLIPMIPSLRKLDLGISNPKLTDEATNIISRHCPNLVYLSLSFSLITRLGLRTIGRGCRKLLFIDLSGCYLIDDEISDFLSYCPRLKIIYLNYLLQISGKSFLSIIKSSQIEYASFTSSKILEVSSSIDLPPPSSNEERSCSKIRKLVLDNCEISDKNLKQISYWCKNLEYLDISLVYDMDDRVLQDLCDRLENLKEVIAKNCYGVSVAMQDNLSKHQRIKFTF
ncbi:unnamed protein product [Rhizophagus irregularis]|nr:unnamed protein product [Rhizophagus irregularis]